MQKLVNNTLHAETNALLVLGETETAAGLHGLLPHLRVVIIQEVNYCLLYEVYDAHGELSKIVISQSLDSESDHFSEILLRSGVFLPCHSVRLLSQFKQELLVTLVKHFKVEIFE